MTVGAGNFNWFGATIQDVLNRFASLSYTPTADDFGGTTAISAMMDAIEAEVESAVGTTVWEAAIFPKLCNIVWRAQPGQTAFQLPAALLPAVPNSLSLWYGAKMMFQLEPRKRDEMGTTWGNANAFDTGAATVDDTRWRTGNYQLYELNVDQFSCDPVGGAGTLLPPIAPMQQDGMVYASWQVDVTNAVFGLSGPNGGKSMRSLASVLTNGVAAKLGQLFYTQGQQVWSLVTDYQNAYESAVEALAKGERIISELRSLRWWTPLEKIADTSASTSRVFRA